jgi:hypothetical protein
MSNQEDAIVALFLRAVDVSGERVPHDVVPSKMPDECTQSAIFSQKSA